MITEKTVYAVLAALILGGCGERRSDEPGDDGPGGCEGSIGDSSGLPHERDVSDAPEPGWPGAVAPATVESLLELDDQDLLGFFQKLDRSDPGKSCEIILQLPLSKQKFLLRASVANLALVDPHAAFAVVDSLQAGKLREECLWSFGRIIGLETWKELGPLLPGLFPEDRIALVDACNAIGVEAIQSIVQVLELNGIDGEPLALAKSKLAYALGNADPDGTDIEMISAMGDREKVAYVNGVLSQNPRQALTAALRLAQDDPGILPRVSGQVVAGMFENDGPNDTISFVSNLNLKPEDHDLLIRTAFAWWLGEEPESASRFIADLPPGMDRKTGIRAVVAYSERVGDEAAAAQWRALLEDE